MNPDPDQLPDDPTLPAALLADLQAIHRTPTVPAALDNAIRRNARAYFGTQRRIRLWFRWAGAAAAAALLGIGIWAAVLKTSHDKEVASGPPAPAANVARDAAEPPPVEDIDLNGSVNVLDAFAVARGIKSRQTQTAWDVNRDGAVSQLDVDQIANRAVRAKGGRQ